MKKVIILLASMHVLTSCDPVANYEKIIVNNTDQQLVIQRTQPGKDVSLLSDSSAINPKSNIVVTEGFDIGGNIQSYSDCPGYPGMGDTLKIGMLVNGQIEPKVTLTSASEWKFKIISKDRAGGGSCECVFEITDDML